MDKRQLIDTILSMRENGKTYQSIADAVGYTKQWVHVLCKTFGAHIPKRTPKPKYTPRPPKEGKTRLAEAKAYAKANGLPNPGLAYASHKSSASYRGLEFSLTFDQWWGLWEKDYAERGPKGKHMCRYLDKGGYTIGNVRIANAKENHQERSLANNLNKAPLWKRMSRNTDWCHIFSEEASIFGRDPLDILLEREGSVP